MNDGYISVSEFEKIELFEGLTLVQVEKGQKKKKRVPLFDVTCAFDIETSTVQIDETLESGETVTRPHSFMYVWQFQFGEQYTVLGRTWTEFSLLLRHLKMQQAK